MIKKEKYDHVISLGFFCNVAMQMEWVGIRDCSSPFDWIISDFNGVIALIENHFCDFLDIDNLQVIDWERNIVRDKKYMVDFYHDFKMNISLESQLYLIKEKYFRRIKRFYDNIDSAKCLFIRYVKNQDEYEYICQNYEKIISVLRGGDLLLIGNKDIAKKEKEIWHVEPGEDGVNRIFLQTDTKLKEYIKHIPYSKKAMLMNDVNE